MIKDGSIVDAQSIDLEAGGRHIFEIFASDAARRTWLREQEGTDNLTPENG
jgi:hypothetical protein